VSARSCARRGGASGCGVAVASELARTCPLMRVLARLRCWRVVMDDSHDGMGPENCQTHMHIHRDDKRVCKW